MGHFWSSQLGSRLRLPFCCPSWVTRKAGFVRRCERVGEGVEKADRSRRTDRDRRTVAGAAERPVQFRVSLFISSAVAKIQRSSLKRTRGWGPPRRESREETETTEKFLLQNKTGPRQSTRLRGQTCRGTAGHRRPWQPSPTSHNHRSATPEPAAPLRCEGSAADRFGALSNRRISNPGVSNRGK